ncbi:hypothetical protein [Pseudodesulfovibrio methanolicus]|uniref:Uncharacterized protein n=1 Tax=Pseudodesulfovibrio methanolicus TaxID=3126690 RepID=A0ABZ2J3U4_9BACT
MCAAVPVALLLLVVLAALTVLRLSKPAPNARLLAGLLDSVGHDAAPAGRRDTMPPASTSNPIRAGKAGTA